MGKNKSTFATTGPDQKGEPEAESRCVWRSQAMRPGAPLGPRTQLARLASPRAPCRTGRASACRWAGSGRRRRPSSCQCSGSLQGGKMVYVIDEVTGAKRACVFGEGVGRRPSCCWSVLGGGRGQQERGMEVCSPVAAAHRTHNPSCECKHTSIPTKQGVHMAPTHALNQPTNTQPYHHRGHRRPPTPPHHHRHTHTRTHPHPPRTRVGDEDQLLARLALVDERLGHQRVQLHVGSRVLDDLRLPGQGIGGWGVGGLRGIGNQECSRVGEVVWRGWRASLKPLLSRAG